MESPAESSLSLDENEISEVVHKESKLMAYLTVLSETSIESKSDEVLVRDVCSAIYSAANEARQVATELDNLQSEGILQQCLAVLDNHKNNAAHLSAAMYVMMALCADRGSAQCLLGDLGAIPKIIDVVKNSPDDVACQVSGCSLLSALIQNADNRAKMVENNAFELVLKKLSAFRSHRDMVCACCAFVANAGCESAIYRDAVLKYGGLREIMVVLGMYRKDEVIVTWCAKSLFCMSSQSLKVQQLVGAQNGVSLLFESLVYFRDTHSLQVYGFGTLHNIIKENSWNARELFSMKGIEVCVRAMRAFRSVMMIQLHCVSVLRTIARLGKPCLKQVVSEGGVNATLSSMISMLSCVEYQERAMSFLRMLVVYDDARQRMVLARGDEIVMRILTSHIWNSQIVEDGIVVVRGIRTRGASVGLSKLTNASSACVA